MEHNNNTAAGDNELEWQGTRQQKQRNELTIWFYEGIFVFVLFVRTEPRQM